MKRMDFLCTSPAATAICTSIDQRSVVSHGHRHHSNYIAEHNSRLHSQRTAASVNVPCSSQLPINPKTFLDKHMKSSSKRSESLRKSSAGVSDLTSRPASARYLLSESAFIDLVGESEHGSALVPVEREPQKPREFLVSEGSPSFNSSSSARSRSLSLQSIPAVKSLSLQASPALKSPSSSSLPRSMSSRDFPSLKTASSSRSRDQVVVLMVSLHCKGCEGKVRKHISKMEGVRSFSIDLETKKVTVIGEVTPLGVLASVSKVKPARLWPSPTSSSPLSSSSPSSTSASRWP